MQLNEILEENTVKAISAKTNIAEDNIDALVASDFEKINRVKAMGFISIIEREYHSDLSAVKAEAIVYYEGLKEDERVTIGLPQPVEKKGKSKLFMFIVFIMIGFAIWYAFINFDKEKLNAMLPFSEEKLSEMIMPGHGNPETEVKTVTEPNVAEELNIENRNTVNEENRTN